MYILDLSDVEFLDDSSTESLLLSGDEYNQDFDSTNFEESQDEDDALNEIVRCICEMDEENGFMIQVTGLPCPNPLSRALSECIRASVCVTNCPTEDRGF